MTDAARPATAPVTPAQADYILFNRMYLRQLAAGIEPRTSASIVAAKVSGGADESRVEATAIERATVTLVVDEAERALRDHAAGWDAERRQRFERVIHYWYVKGFRWRRIARKVHYVPQHCRRLRDEARKAVAEWLSALPGTTMADFWRVADKYARLAEESRANERRARSGVAGKGARG